MLCLEETFLGLPCATDHHEKHFNLCKYEIGLFDNGKICNDPSSVSQWEKFTMIPDLFHNGKNLQCFTMGKFAMILALFHNGEICNGSRLCFTMGQFAMGPGSVSQWESLQ